jgi:hypothetical protein
VQAGLNHSPSIHSFQIHPFCPIFIIMKTTFITALAATLTLPMVTIAAPAFDIKELEGTNLAPEDVFLAKRQYTSSNYNQLTDGTACRPISLIYARGTSQQGNVGDSAAVGPLFFNNLASRVGGTSKIAIQGVTYSASVSGFLNGGDAAGSTTMTNLISSVSVCDRQGAIGTYQRQTDCEQVPVHQNSSLWLQSRCAACAQCGPQNFSGERSAGCGW